MVIINYERLLQLIEFNHYGFYSPQLTANRMREKFFMAVGSMEAAVERTGMYSQRVIKNFSLIRLNTPTVCGEDV